MNNQIYFDSGINCKDCIESSVNCAECNVGICHKHSIKYDRYVVLCILCKKDREQKNSSQFRRIFGDKAKLY